jgi:NDP-sugar pyrophosphorylase family protein
MQAAGIQKVIICAGFRASQLQNWLGDGSRWGLSVQYSVEQTSLGTAGALKLAEKLINTDSFFAMNGDSFLGVGLQEMYRYHVAHSALATMAVTHRSEPGRYGMVEMNEAGGIVGFREKNSDGNPVPAEHPTLINGGVYVLQRQFLDLIPSGRAVSLEEEVFPSIAGKDLCGFVTNSYFIDIGVPADLERAQTELPTRFFV